MRSNRVTQIVFSSTCSTYGVLQRIPITEEHPQAPINPYGASKLMIERMLADFGAAYGMHSVSLRYFNAAGADPDGEIDEDHGPETHLIPTRARSGRWRTPSHHHLWRIMTPLMEPASETIFTSPILHRRMSSL